MIRRRLLSHDMPSQIRDEKKKKSGKRKGDKIRVDLTCK